MIDGQVSVYKDEKVGYGFGERERFGESVPCYWVGIEDDGEERRRRTCWRYFMSFIVLLYISEIFLTIISFKGT
jgi:hypothetical protein